MFSSVVSWRFISVAAFLLFYFSILSFFFGLLFFSKQFAQVQLPLDFFLVCFCLLIGSPKKIPLNARLALSPALSFSLFFAGACLGGVFG